MMNRLWNTSLVWRGLSALYAMVFVTAALEKIAGGKVPSWFLSQFEASFLARLPGGLAISFWAIALTETFLAVAFVTSFFRRKDPRTSSLLRLALMLAFLLFTALCFGQRISGKYDAAAFLFIEALLSAFVLNAMPEGRRA